MIPEPWLYALLIVVVGAQLLTVAYVSRRIRFHENDASPTAGPGRSAGSEEVVCPDCGAKNEPGYRYCGRCVSELPGTAAVGRRPVPPIGGRSL
ncbi:DUF7577 domain-containing protein [Haloplanus sp.]|uniref:DUF7577 domain-containing protein n=1 Tax=Haloplanus sp. TaxID=1961696 RepID=UPI002618DA76|nr:hypothetical protein [Haloplanus sp.]